VKAARDACGTFGDQAEQQLGEALGIVAATALELGVHIGAKARALLDSHSVSFGGGTIVEQIKFVTFASIKLSIGAP